jgi:hypothetical protein
MPAKETKDRRVQRTEQLLHQALGSLILEKPFVKLSGHKSWSVFDRYNIVSEGDPRDAARR